MKIGSEKGNKVEKVIKIKTYTQCHKYKELQRHLEDGSQTKRVQNNHINRPVRTTRAVVQHYNAAICTTTQITQKQFSYSTLPLDNITSQMWP